MVFTNQTPPAGTVSLTFSNAILARGLRLYATKLSSDGSNHYLQIAEFKALGTEPWAYPSELRGKKVIGSGQYTALNPNDPEAPTPKYPGKQSRLPGQPSVRRRFNPGAGGSAVGHQPGIDQPNPRMR